MNEVFDIGITGLTDGYRRAGEAGVKLINSFSPNQTQDDPVDAIIELNAAARQVEASATVINTANQLNRYILDLWA